MKTLHDRPVQELAAKFLTAPGAVPERVLRRLQESLVWAGFRVQPLGRRRHADTYFDTPDQDLRRAGWSLSERDDGCHRSLSLKEVNRARAGIFDRKEFSQVLDAPGRASAPTTNGHPLPDAAPYGAVIKQLTELLPSVAHLAPSFRIATERDVYRLSHPEHPGGIVELALDRSQIEEYVHFVELEVCPRQALPELLANVLAIAELEPGLLTARVSKFERGLIATSCAGTHQPGSTRGVDREANALEVASDYLKRQLARIKLFEPHAWEGIHPEGVHQMRVAARRARAGLHAFDRVLPAAEAQRLATGLQELATVLGAVRDLDVHLAHLADYRALLDPAEQHRLRNYEDRLLYHHAESRFNLLKFLDKAGLKTLLDDYRCLLLASARAANGSPLRLGEVAPEAVAASLAKLERRGRRVDRRRRTAADLHRLRLAAKCLRYQLECLEGAYPDVVGIPLATLRTVQDRLGRYQDTCLARSHLKAHRRDHTRGKRERRLIDRLIEFEKQRARQELEHLPADLQQFRAASAGLRDGL
jgi:triphosphatase